MQINGEWLLCEDGVVRPVIRGRILGGNGSRTVVEFLVDTGADRTVLSAAILLTTDLPQLETKKPSAASAELPIPCLSRLSSKCNAKPVSRLFSAVVSRQLLIPLRSTSAFSDAT